MQPAAVLDFWFSDRAKPYWFEKNDAFDRAVAETLLPLTEAAAAGALDAWADTPEGALALVILLDQVPRNCHRGSARAFAHDARARAVARKALDRGFDAGFDHDRRVFLYLPFEHAEDMGTQVLSMALYGALHGDDWEKLKWAARHAEIIERFGRFPHRNEALGRASTAEELAFLKEPMSAF